MKKFKNFDEFLSHYGFTKNGSLILDAGKRKVSQSDLKKLKDYFETTLKPKGRKKNDGAKN